MYLTLLDKSLADMFLEGSIIFTFTQVLNCCAYDALFLLSIGDMMITGIGAAVEVVAETIKAVAVADGSQFLLCDIMEVISLPIKVEEEIVLSLMFAL